MKKLSLEQIREIITEFEWNHAINENYFTERGIDFVEDLMSQFERVADDN